MRPTAPAPSFFQDAAKAFKNEGGQECERWKESLDREGDGCRLRFHRWLPRPAPGLRRATPDPRAEQRPSPPVQPHPGQCGRAPHRRPDLRPPGRVGRRACREARERPDLRRDQRQHLQEGRYGRRVESASPRTRNPSVDSAHLRRPGACASPPWRRSPSSAAPASASPSASSTRRASSTPATAPLGRTLTSTAVDDLLDEIVDAITAIYTEYFGAPNAHRHAPAHLGPHRQGPQGRRHGRVRLPRRPRSARTRADAPPTRFRATATAPNPDGTPLRPPGLHDPERADQRSAPRTNESRVIVGNFSRGPDPRPRRASRSTQQRARLLHGPTRPSSGQRTRSASPPRATRRLSTSSAGRPRRWMR